jgi:hypothetical protein
LQQLVDNIARALRCIDRSAIPFKQFHPGVGPYGEPQLTKLFATLLAEDKILYEGARTCRVPDMLIPNRWALEFKIVRPFGDNGIEAEHWSQNLLHPYPGNVSAIADAMKLMERDGPEKKGIIVIAYEHEPPKIDLSVLVAGFELISTKLLRLPIGERKVSVVQDCIHPIHRRATVYGWQLFS